MQGEQTDAVAAPSDRITGMALRAIGLTAFVLALAVSDSLVSSTTRPVLAIGAMLLTLVGLMMLSPRSSDDLRATWPAAR